MNNVTTRIDGIYNKVQGLIQLQDQLVEENRRLKDQSEKLIANLDEGKKKIKELEEKNKLVRIAKSLTGETDGNTHELKLKINEMIREIDKCIAQLNN